MHSPHCILPFIWQDDGRCLSTWHGANGVVRFDIQGNDRVLIVWNE